MTKRTKLSILQIQKRTMLEDTTPEELEQTVKEIDIRVKDKEAQLQKLLISLQKTKKEVIDNFESVQHTYLQNFKLPPTSTQPNNQKFEIPSEEDLNLAKSAYQNANQGSQLIFRIFSLLLTKSLKI